MSEQRWTRDEASLLLYMETCVVNDAGIYDPRKVNSCDLAIMDRWQELGFVTHGRVASDYLTPSRTLWVHMSDSAMEVAQKLRCERAKRMWKDRTWKTTEEKRNE